MVTIIEPSPGGAKGRTKGEGDLRSDGAERIELERKDLLRSCRGFTVDFGGGRVGRVIDVRFDPLSGQPRALIVEAGLFQRRSVEVPVIDVASVIPAKRRVVLCYPGIAGVAGQGRTISLPPKGAV